MRRNVAFRLSLAAEACIDTLFRPLFRFLFHVCAIALPKPVRLFTLDRQSVLACGNNLRCQAAGRADVWS